jgi:acetyl/propionyl-CoA carboxylase alpha subunit
VAVFSDPDAGAPHVVLADEAVRLPGSSPADTYLRADLMIEAALRSGADAVHPGYGFLSENASFARACDEAGLTFVGPPANVIEAMGSKLTAKATMESAGVPVLPTVRIEASESGSGSSSGSLAERTAPLGFPLLVKASAGGGGRGMRIVEDAGSLAAAIESAQREAQSAFGDSTLFIEPYALRPRHIEVQVMGDTHGNVVHLFERECSIQRRHQKIVEESPSVAVDEAARARLCDIAIAAAKAIGYVNAGTVEFLMLQDGSFAFLEVNTRLQVEHPVTELVTGLDLVRLQFLVAEGGALPDSAKFAEMHGHAIEVRLYAEDPTNDWRPSTGRLHRFDVPRSAAIRVDTGVTEGTVVSPWYDPMLAKVIAYAPTRSEAARALASALSHSQFHGVTTNRDLLVNILRHPEFLAGQIDTGFLVRHDPAELGAPLASLSAEALHAIAAALSGQASRRAAAKVLGGMPSGWRNNSSQPQKTLLYGHAGFFDVTYGFDRSGKCVDVTSVIRAEDGSVVSETPAGVEVVSAEPKKVIICSGGVTRTYSVQQVDQVVFVDGPDGSSVLTLVDRFPLPGSQLDPGSLVAPLPGTVVRVEVSPGDQVEPGDVLVAIEAMKMEHVVRAGHSGTVEDVAVRAGDQVESGRLLVVIHEQSADPTGGQPADPTGGQPADPTGGQPAENPAGEQ